MNLLNIFTRFPDQEACIQHLEATRWGDNPCCPHCGSLGVAPKADSGRIGRWNCHDCKSSFNALSGTIFEKTRIPLQKWFMAIGLIVNAKKSLSSCQLARDLDLNQKSGWYLLHRIRAEMASKQSEIRLQGIVEADETYIGGKPRKRNKISNNKDLTPPPPPPPPPIYPRGRGTRKTAIIGAVERGGNVVAHVANDLSGKGVLRFIKDVVEPSGSLLITDEYRAYNAVRSTIAHATVNHSKREYVNGQTHTNTIEGFWSLLKRAWYGTHHHYNKKYMPLYVAEMCWKYNQRKDSNTFGVFMQGCFA